MKKQVELIEKLVDFAYTLGKEDQGKIEEVMNNGGRPVSEAVVEVLTTLDSVVRGNYNPEDIVKVKGFIPVISYSDGEELYSLAFVGRLNWDGEWLSFEEGEFSLVKEATGEVVASVNKNVFPSHIVDRIEVVAMVAGGAPPEVVEKRLEALQKEGARLKM